jgi:hypothetical protein
MSARRVAVVPAVRWAVGVAARALPTAADRRRYHAEFVAELHDLPPAEQLRYAAGVLSQVPALRGALRTHSHPTEEVAMPSTFRCRALRWHHWTHRAAPHHGHIRVCIRCGREQGPFHTPDERPTARYLHPGI